MKKRVGQVTPEECLEIKKLFERRSGLAELVKILTPDNEQLYEKLVGDMALTQSRFQNWWDSMAEKYSWESDDNGSWEIDFNTREIYLVV